MNGRRLPDSVLGEPGGGWSVWQRAIEHPERYRGCYMRVTLRPPREWHYWYLVDPHGSLGALAAHHAESIEKPTRWQVEEHPDGTITLKPSIWDKSEGGYHGHLQQGVWNP